MAEIITVSKQIGSAHGTGKILYEKFYFDDNPSHRFNLEIFASGEDPAYSYAMLEYLGANGYYELFSLVTSAITTVYDEADANNLDEAGFAEDMAALHAFAESFYNLKTA